MRAIFEAIAFAIVSVVVGLMVFSIYAATAVIYGAPLIFVLWLFGVS